MSNIVGTGSAYLRNDGRWACQLEFERLNGKRYKKYFYAKSKRAVKQKMNDYIANYEDELQSKDTVEYLINEWLTNFKQDLKPSSYDRLECSIRVHINPYIGSSVVTSVTTLDLQKILNDMKDKGLSFSSIKKIYNSLNDFFKYAYNTRLIKHNPSSALKLPKRENTKPIKEIRVFTQDEIQAFKTACTAKTQKGNLICDVGYSFILMLNTGLRLGEMLALTFSSIDFKNHTLTVSQSASLVQNRNGNEYQKGRKVILQSPKTASAKRTIPLNKTAMEAVNKLKEQFFNGDEKQLILNSNGEPLNPRSYTKRFYTILNKAEIERTGLHTLRHTFASVLFAKDTPVKVISTILGHSQTSTTEDIYIHLLPKRTEKALIDVEI